MAFAISWIAFQDMYANVYTKFYQYVSPVNLSLSRLILVQEAEAAHSRQVLTKLALSFQAP